MRRNPERKENISRHIVVLLLVLSLCSCKTPSIVGTQEYVSNDTVYLQTETFRDTIYISSIKRDFVRDSVFLFEKETTKNDTIYIEREKTIYKEREVLFHDTIYISRNAEREEDTHIRETHEVVETVKEEIKRKSVPWRCLVVIASIAGIITVLYRLYTINKRIK